MCVFVCFCYEVLLFIISFDNVLNALFDSNIPSSQNPNAAKEIIAKSAARSKATIQRAKDEIISKMEDEGFCPRDLIRN